MNRKFKVTDCTASYMRKEGVDTSNVSTWEINTNAEGEKEAKLDAIRQFLQKPHFWEKEGKFAPASAFVLIEVEEIDENNQTQTG